MRISIPFLMLIILFTACNSSKKEQQPTSYSNSEFVGFKEKAIKIVPMLKSSHDLVLFFELIEVPFIPQLVNNPSNSERYNTTNLLAAANMGVYFADAMYQKSYGKTVGADSSIMAAVELAKTLGIDEVFTVLAKIKDRADMMPLDSIIYKMDESLMKAEYILAENERMQIYIAILTGNYIQKQYILLSLIFEFQKEPIDDNKLVSLNELFFVLGQYKDATQTLVEQIEKYKPTDGSGFLANEISNYNKNLQSLQIGDNIHTMTPKMIFENETLKSMFSSVNSMRNYIIQKPVGL